MIQRVAYGSKRQQEKLKQKRMTMDAIPWLIQSEGAEPTNIPTKCNQEITAIVGCEPSSFYHRGCIPVGFTFK